MDRERERGRERRERIESLWRERILERDGNGANGNGDKRLLGFAKKVSPFLSLSLS